MGGIFNLYFSLKLVLDQNHQVHTRESGKIPPEEDPSTSPFYPSRDNPDLLLSFLPLPQNLRVSREREREISRVVNPVGLSFFHVTAPHFFYSRSSTQFHPHEIRVGVSPMPRKGARSLMPLMWVQVCSCLNELKLNSQNLNPRLSS